MNCQETRNLFEDALDRRLKGGVKRKFDLHLTRCPFCRSLYAAEEAEHVRWFRALNGEGRGRKLPPGFADRLAAAVSRQSAARRVFADWLRLPRWAGIAAVLALMFAAFATIAWRIENGELRIENDGDDSGIENGELRMENDGGVSQTNSQFSILNSQFPKAVSTTIKEGEKQMNGRKMKSALLGVAAMSAAQLGAGGGEYQFIISGYPAADSCHSDVSSGTSLGFGVLSDISVSDALDARSRTDDLSNHSPLRSDKFRGMKITIR